MRFLTAEVIAKNDKAVLYFPADDGADISCMIDTGANVPIWFMGENFLKLRFPSAHLTDKLTIIHGLGKEPLLDVPVWNIPEFVMTDDNGEKIIFHDLLIPIIKASRYSFNMLIPLTMLNRTKFSFDYKLSSNFGYFTIETEKDNFFIRPVYVKEHPQYLNKIQAFYQNER